jgi:hypothetical protein
MIFFMALTISRTETNHSTLSYDYYGFIEM